jgi:hypothetical protein
MQFMILFTRHPLVQLDLTRVAGRTHGRQSADRRHRLVRATHRAD